MLPPAFFEFPFRVRPSCDFPQISTARKTSDARILNDARTIRIQIFCFAPVGPPCCLLREKPFKARRYDAAPLSSWCAVLIPLTPFFPFQQLVLCPAEPLFFSPWEVHLIIPESLFPNFPSERRLPFLFHSVDEQISSVAWCFLHILSLFFSYGILILGILFDYGD